MIAARAVFDSMEDPPSGVAAAGNHPVDRHPKHHHGSSSASTTLSTGPVYREPSTWDTMVRCELAAGENERAVKLLRRVEERAFPEAGESRFRSYLSFRDGSLIRGVRFVFASRQPDSQASHRRRSRDPAHPSSFSLIYHRSLSLLTFRDTSPSTLSRPPLAKHPCVRFHYAVLYDVLESRERLVLSVSSHRSRIPRAEIQHLSVVASNSPSQDFEPTFLASAHRSEGGCSSRCCCGG
jgi:hypothetical protein